MSLASASVVVVHDDGEREVFELAGGFIDLVVMEKTCWRQTATLLLVAGDSKADGPLEYVHRRHMTCAWCASPSDEAVYLNGVRYSFCPNHVSEAQSMIHEWYATGSTAHVVTGSTEYQATMGPGPSEGGGG